MLEIAASVDSRATCDDHRCFQVPRGEQKSIADTLRIAGLLERPNSRALRYQITERGRQRAKFVQKADMPDLSNLSESQAELVRQAYRNLATLMGDLYMQGYLLYHEPGRAITYGQIAFYNPYIRGSYDTYLLYRRRIGSPVWELHPLGYHKAGDATVEQYESALAQMTASGF